MDLPLLKKILKITRSINKDEFQEQLTSGNNLESLFEEISFLKNRLEDQNKRKKLIIKHITNCSSGDFFKQFPVSEKGDELDVISMGFNTYIEELEGIMVSRDELSKLNFDLQIEKEITEKLSRSKDIFMSNMSHEIRTPLNAILGFTDLLNNSTNLTNEQQKQLELIKISGDILLVIINDILDLSKIEAGKMRIEEHPLNLKELTQLIIDAFVVKISEKELTVNIVTDINLPNNLLSDSVRISQILFNLVSNAIKFTQNKGSIDIEILLKDDNQQSCIVEIIIQDSGIGIPEDKLYSIFDAFEQTSNDMSRKYGGTGLGLTIVKKIITLMDGDIFVKSDVGFGTKFIIYLPFRKKTKNSMKDVSNNLKSLKIEETEKITETRKILLAEDNVINQLLAQTVLKRFGFIVTTVDNGKLALEAIEKEDFDLILMDLMMPEIDGYEATKLIRELNDENKKNIPIIALTADVVSINSDKCKKWGMNDYISKPFEPQNLFIKINQLIALNKRF